MAHRDLVLYSTDVFRSLLDCMSRPGVINFVRPFPSATAASLHCLSPVGLGVAYTLLDGEVTFHLYRSDDHLGDDHRSDGSESGSVRYLAGLTGSRPRALEDCDFLLLSGCDASAQLERLKRGTLEFCDESATVICEVITLEAGNEGSLSSIGASDIAATGNTASSTGASGDASSVLIALTGPGIAGEARLRVKGLAGSLLESFIRANCEYPKGLDMILVSSSGLVACIPRSSRLIWEVA